MEHIHYTLQKAILPVHSQTSCFIYWAFSAFADSNVCAGTLSGSRVTCTGDSG